MNTDQVIEIIKATSGSLDSLISQVAWFFAIGAAAQWLSVTLPCLLVGGILLRVAKTVKLHDERGDVKAAKYTLAAWVMFAATMFTGVHGLAPIMRAVKAPSVYVATEAGELHKAITKAFEAKP